METVAENVVIARVVGDGPTQKLEPLEGLGKVREALEIIARELALAPKKRTPLDDAYDRLSEFLAAHERGE